MITGRNRRMRNHKIRCFALKAEACTGHWLQYNLII